MNVTPVDYGLGYIYHASIMEFEKIEESLRTQSNEEGYIVLDRGADTSLQYLQVYYDGHLLDTNNMIAFDTLEDIQTT